MANFKASVGTKPGFLTRDEFAEKNKIAVSLAYVMGDAEGNLSTAGRVLEASDAHI